MAWVLGVSLFTMMATSSLAMYIPKVQPCATGNACANSFSRSYVNNIVYCCTSGGGMSVSSFGNNVHCECGGGGNGFMVSNLGGNVMVSGQQVNASSAQMANLQNSFQQASANFRQQMATFHQQMAALRARLQNMFNGFGMWW